MAGDFRAVASRVGGFCPFSRCSGLVLENRVCYVLVQLFRTASGTFAWGYRSCKKRLLPKTSNKHIPSDNSLVSSCSTAAGRSLAQVAAQWTTDVAKLFGRLPCRPQDSGLLSLRTGHGAAGAACASGRCVWGHGKQLPGEVKPPKAQQLGQSLTE